jgi:hypothetical protein
MCDKGRGKYGDVSSYQVGIDPSASRIANMDNF